jgi:tRNA (mo5U34)-methyltransferase
MPAMGDSATTARRQRVEAFQWYHTIDLGDGLVTPGWFDTRPTVAKVPLPATLEGKRCLDVGTWDGFWAFEMERRGADSVTAIDVRDQDRWDWPPVMRMQRENTGRDVLEAFKDEDGAFEVAKQALGSQVERRDLSVYELDPAEHGAFDFIFLGSLLLHLRDPVAALAAIRGVCGGEAVIAETIDLWPSLTRPRTPTARIEGIERPWWWQPNRAALHQMVRSAGFEILEASPIYILPRGPAHPKGSLRRMPSKLLSAQGREELVVGLRGIPHTAVRVRPVQT